MTEEIIRLRNQAIAHITETTTVDELESVRANYLGKQGYFTKIIKDIAKVDKDERKRIGIQINETKQTIEQFLQSHMDTISKHKDLFDETMPGIKAQIGHLHLVTSAIDEIASVFEKIGFVRMRYPEVEYDWFSFESLNFDKNHPARDDWETFFIKDEIHSEFGPMLLTPHTSSGQVREMKRVQTPPIRMINISKTYRRQTDVSHVPMFHQFEGLVIDTNISIANLKGTLDYFAKTFFGPSRVTRLRPYNFPFTEPSFEIDISCGICNGAGCKLCKAGWLELGGAGMVHPNVLKYGGIDSKKYRGFAFGWGVERTFMMKANLGIADVRLLYSNDIRFLKQF